MKLYERIRSRREELGMSQEELAKKIGYKSRSSINKIEMGENDIPQSKINIFARALDTTPAYLMGWEEWDNESLQFENKINALFYELKSLGWTYEWLDDEKIYIFLSTRATLKVTADEYSDLAESLHKLCYTKIQKLLLGSSQPLLNAANPRTDIEIPEGVDTSEDDVFDDF